jgi:hypothetical protein
MSIQAKLKVSSMTEKGLNINVYRIVQKLPIRNFLFRKEKDFLLIDCEADDYSTILQLKRNLGSKKNRKGTVIEIVSFQNKQGGEQV